MFSKLFGAMLIACTALVLPAQAADITLRVDKTPSIFADMFKDLVTAFEAKNPTIHFQIDTSQRHQIDTIQRTDAPSRDKRSAGRLVSGLQLPEAARGWRPYPASGRPDGGRRRME
ncbi:exported hypothetical protein [Mesorhizobium metallidurans STM 2683]|uniref:Uncharacterized protein n=1 Tax=Mesorhizobium metallidurans STM 2683 TaxID=1297569 RepID=M5ETN7_9HYPH|nr:hypothetical protein [Mesorhizobium metallidurans]CCV03066.1 exported hypothetical protein [Mesorhizobium metallidurans STM 2683]